MHDWLTKRLGLRLKRSIGFGLMIATTGGLFWYVLALARLAEAPFAGALVFALVLLALSTAVAHATIYRKLRR